jgi:hypothetical protein
MSVPVDASGTGTGAGAMANRGSGSGSRPGAPREARRPVRARTGPVDPVRELMHRHRELCERAVDPLEIAAGLEAHGVTDRTAARFRHRDVFSLAEELFARVPRAEGEPSEATDRQECRAVQHRPHSAYGAHRSDGACRRIVRAVAVALLALLPGMLAVSAFVLFELGDVSGEGALATIGFVAGAAVVVAVSVWLALRHVVRAPPNLLMALGTCCLTGFGAGPGGAGVALPLSLACALAPAVWCARRFAARARRRLAESRSLDEFADGMRPLLTVTVVLFAVVLVGLQFAAEEITAWLAQRGDGNVLFAADALSATTALGVLLFTALLLTAHGSRGAATAALCVACTLELLALAAGAVPPVGHALAAFGPNLVPAGACGCAAAGLLAYAYRVLTRASAHRLEYAEHLTERSVREDCGGRRNRAACEPCESCEPCQSCETCEACQDARE